MKDLNLVPTFLWFLLLFPLHKAVANGVTPEETKQLRDEASFGNPFWQKHEKGWEADVREMFYHAFDGYMEHAFPLDELRPLSCEGEDTLGGYALTLIDSLDTLALLGDRERFTASVEWIGKNLQFDINKTVSIFETTIRVLGGLLSAHLIASDYATLCHIAGIPFGSVNLKYGVDEHESKITSTAGGGTLTLEFGVLSRLTNDPRDKVHRAAGLTRKCVNQNLLARLRKVLSVDQ
ncbi:putative alpha-mannosidase I MNS4 [Gossypium australe]|uniref:alpha-1,2-Mannosidase n=1 Tax=Gossypium australe TaxID=47621 RepID=A0A5B6U9F5_9ROSI|nr:putative alpha-mannosidase I MNS4 [Gossypium australe]